MARRRRLVGMVAVALAAAGPLAAQFAAPAGRIIEIADGDVVVMPRSASAAVIARSTAQVRLIHDARQQVVLLLVQPAADAAASDGEILFHVWELNGPATLPPRWEGQSTVDEYRPSSRGPSGLAVDIGGETVFFGRWPDAFATLPRPSLVVATRGGRGGTTSGTLDELEQAWTIGGADALVSRGRGPRLTARLQVDPAAGPAPRPALPRTLAPGTLAPVRVGGNIRAPTRLVNVVPVYPEQAKAAAVQGVVILEVTIDPAGVPADVRVLRSIPLLDDAAIEAVKQWRYEPTLLNGTAVPVIMTVTVKFTLQQ